MCFFVSELPTELTQTTTLNSGHTTKTTWFLAVLPETTNQLNCRTQLSTTQQETNNINQPYATMMIQYGHLSWIAALTHLWFFLVDRFLDHPNEMPVNEMWVRTDNTTGQDLRETVSMCTQCNVVSWSTNLNFINKWPILWAAHINDARSHRTEMFQLQEMALKRNNCATNEYLWHVPFFFVLYSLARSVDRIYLWAGSADLHVSHPNLILQCIDLHLQTFAWGQCRRRRWHVPRILLHNSRFVRIQCWYLELDLHSFRSQSIDHSLRVFHEISLNVGGYESNNVVCIPNVILFNSQLSVSCSSNSLYKTVLIAQSFVEKPFVKKHIYHWILIAFFECSINKQILVQN